MYIYSFQKMQVCWIPSQNTNEHNIEPIKQILNQSCISLKWNIIFKPDHPLVNLYTENITRWGEHMKFIFEWKKYFTSEHSEQVKSFFHEKINFICSSQRAIFFLLHRYKCFENYTHFTVSQTKAWSQRYLH